MVAELTSPDLFVVFVDKLAGLIEHAFTILAELSISSHKLASMLEAIELNFEDICVEFNGELLSVFLRNRSLHARRLELLSHVSAIRIIVTEIQISVELVRVHFFTGKIAID